MVSNKKRCGCIDRGKDVESRSLYLVIAQLFMEGHTYVEIADAVCLSEGSVSNRIRRMRKAGVDLPWRSPEPDVMNVDAINEAIGGKKKRRSRG